jgi:hypothetical protein
MPFKATSGLAPVVMPPQCQELKILPMEQAASFLTQEAIAVPTGDCCEVSARISMLKEPNDMTMTV